MPPSTIKTIIFVKVSIEISFGNCPLPWCAHSLFYSIPSFHIPMKTINHIVKISIEEALNFSIYSSLLLPWLLIPSFSPSWTQTLMFAPILLTQNYFIGTKVTHGDHWAEMRSGDLEPWRIFTPRIPKAAGQPPHIFKGPTIVVPFFPCNNFGFGNFHICFVTNRVAFSSW